MPLCDDKDYQELVSAYDDYIALLVRGENMLLGLATAHGFRFPEDMINQGAELRARIARAKKAFAE